VIQASHLHHYNCHIHNPLSTEKRAFQLTTVLSKHFYNEQWVADYTFLVARTAAAEPASTTTSTATSTTAEASTSISTRLSFVDGQTATV
jgi:hypothetical protein